jgi:ABC-type amino acid transport substrate-binding protein
VIGSVVVRTIFLASLACGMLLAHGVAAETVVIEADSDYAPYSYVEKGQLKGIYVDFLKVVAQRL